MKKKILLFSRDPGGANAIMPLYGPLVQKGFIVRLFGKDFSLAKYVNFGLKGLDIGEIITTFTIKMVEAFLRKEKPDLIVTGTSADDFVEKYMWKSSEKLGIPSFAILDQWSNYGVRFSPYNVDSLTNYKKEPSHPFLPTKILVMDEYAKEQVIKEGIPSKRVTAKGHPYFEHLLQQPNSSGKVLEFKNMHNLSESDYVITYASEPIAEIYGNTKNAIPYLGYTQKTIFQNLQDALRVIVKKTPKRITCIIKLHSKENKSSYNDAITSESNQLRFVVDNESHPWDVIRSSHLVCGMSSMFLIESAMLQVPIISIQIGLRRENQFMLHRRGIIKSVMKKEELIQKLDEYVVNEKKPQYYFDVIENPIEKIIGYLENVLCPN